MVPKQQSGSAFSLLQAVCCFLYTDRSELQIRAQFITLITFRLFHKNRGKVDQHKPEEKEQQTKSLLSLEWTGVWIGLKLRLAKMLPIITKNQKHHGSFCYLLQLQIKSTRAKQ